MPGPIIILTATDSTCFALIVRSLREVQYLTLPEFILPKAHLLADLSRGLSNPAFDFDKFLKTCEVGSHKWELQARMFAGRERTVKLDSDEVFRELLAVLWNNVVKPVLEALNLQASTTFDCVSTSSYFPVEIS
jgi:hypothetical protein